MLEQVNCFTQLKKIKKYIYDPEANLFKPELDEQGQEKDGYDLYPDHDHYDYGENDYSKSYTGIQNNPLTKFLILGDFDKKFKAESVMENWHGMSYKSKISSDAQFLCSDENVNLIISEGLRFLEIGWKYRNNYSGSRHRCDDPEKNQDIYIKLSNIVSLLIYTSEIRRLPYKDGEPIKKYGSPETKVKLTEENAIKLMKEVDRQIKNVSGLLGKDFDLSRYNELCQKISETESEFKKCQNEWFNLLRRSDVKVEYAKYQDNGKKKDILYELTDVDKLKAKYSVEYDIPFIKNNKSSEQNYCVWDRISKGRQQEFTKIDERQKPLKNKLNELKTQQQNVLNRISASSDNYHTEEKKRIERLTKLMSIKSDIEKMIYSQISGNTKLDENNPIEVIKNVVPQIDSTKENIDVPQTENQIKINEEESEKINIEEDKNSQDQNISNSEVIQPDNNTLNKSKKNDLIQNDNNEDIGQSENTEEIQIELSEEKEDKNSEEIDNEEDENIQDQNINSPEIIQQDNNSLDKSQEEDLIQNDNNEDIGQSENTEEIQIKLNQENEDKEDENPGEVDNEEYKNIQNKNISNSEIIQLDNNTLNENQEKDLIQNKNNDKLIEQNENTEEIQIKLNQENEDKEDENPGEVDNEEDKNSQDQNINSPEIIQQDNNTLNENQEKDLIQNDNNNKLIEQNENTGEILDSDNNETKNKTNLEDKYKDEKYINPEANIDKDDKMNSENDIAQTDSKNSTDNAIVRFFKWLINKIRSWFGYPELWSLNNVKIPDEINSVGPEENQQLQNKNPKLEELSQDPNKQNKGI